ncbi:MAG TPA: HK97 gp10 family phage protein [Mycobacterium sp.]|jgi:HK97 gp10 family phage protein|uniref:HK97 gp10 family phage protein n=1 Tax=Mycobacterium sp. TaxID=1785 RepID=UPI002F3FF0CA
MHLDVSELRGLEHDLGAGAAKVEKAAPLVVSKTAHDIEATAKIFVPVETGTLKGSISTDVHGLEAEIGPTASYGRYVEDGTHNDDGTQRNRPQPYMGPAADTHESTFEAALGKVAESIL